MKVGEQRVATPAEDPAAYPLDWRFRIAQAVVGMPNGSKLRMPSLDRDTRMLIRHLTGEAMYGAGKPEACQRAVAWHGTSLGEVLEAYLLAVDSLADVSAELELPEDDVRLYANLFFDVRDTQGRRRTAVLQRIAAEAAREEGEATPPCWKIALRSGLAGLRSTLRGSTSSGSTLDALVERELARRLHAGELRTGDLVRLQANTLARERLAMDREQGRDGPSDGLMLAQGLLAAMAPQMVEAQGGPKHIEASNTAIRQRLGAIRLAVETPVTDDPERGRAALKGMLDRAFGRSHPAGSS